MSIQGQGDFLTIAKGHLDIKKKTKKNLFFLETTGPFVTEFHRKAFR